MKSFLITVFFIFYILFFPGGNLSTSYAQKTKYVDPKKESKGIQKRIQKENKVKEKRRQQFLKKKGIGERKKKKSTKGRKSQSYLDKVLKDSKKVSPDKRKEAYNRDRKLSKAKSRQKSKMGRNKVRKRKPPKIKH